MPYRRVLMVHSFADAGMAARLKQINDAPALDGIAFEHVAVNDDSRASPLLAEMNEVARRSITEFRQLEEAMYGELLMHEVLPLLRQRIEEFRPDLILVHGGTIFRAATPGFLRMLANVRSEYPDLPIGLEGRTEWLQWESGRTHGPLKRQAAAARVRWVKENVIISDDVDLIIDNAF